MLCDYWLIKKPKFIESNFVGSKIAPFISDNRISVVCISGGEPTLHPELGRIVRTVRESGASVTLTTSTTNLEDHFEAIRGLVTHYMISIDGADRNTYIQSRGVDRFDHALDWARKLRTDTSAEVAVSCVLQACNISSVRLIYQLCLANRVQRLFFRVPDLKPNSFGRVGSVRTKALERVAISQAQVDEFRADLLWLQKADALHGLLGQNAKALERKAKYFEAAVLGQAYSEDDQICDVPLTSLVIQADGTCRPCFYLPQSQPFSPTPLSGPAFVEVHKRMLEDESFRRQWCNACQQFDGHKHRAKVGGI